MLTFRISPQGCWTRSITSYRTRNERGQVDALWVVTVAGETSKCNNAVLCIGSHKRGMGILVHGEPSF